MKHPVFPSDFLWGASTSAHQHEGGTHNQWTVWERENAKTKAAQADYVWGETPGWERFREQARQPDNYVSKNGVDHFRHYKKDIALAKQLHLNTIRFSIEWSRIEPEQGSWNAEAVQHYKAYLAELERQQITPVVCLFHFTLPVWFSEKGGFLKRRNIKYFERFAEKIFTEFAGKFRYVLTVNEPNVYAMEGYYRGNWPPNRTSVYATWKVIHNLSVAHNRVAKLAKKLDDRYQLSPAFNISHVYPGDDALLSRLSADAINYVQNIYMIQRSIKYCDFIGVNYYFANRVYGYRIHNPNRRRNDLGWDMQPLHLEHVLEDMHDRYKKPIMVTENGVADADDVHRQWWIESTLRAMHRAMKHDVDLIGYMHWSLTDNFEWDKGFWPRFGLIAIDYATGKRQVRKSAQWYASVIEKFQDQASQP